MTAAPAVPVTVLANTRSGTGCPADWAESVTALFGRNGKPAVVTCLGPGEDVAKATQRALDQGAPAVVAAGGDGTVSAVAAVLAGGSTPLGVLPMGTLNHFAKDLGIPLKLEDAVATVAAGHMAAVDVGEVNGEVFINNSSLGLYPDIVLEREQLRRRLGHGKWRALLQASLHAARRYPVMRVLIELDGHGVERRTPFVFIGNNAYEMEGFGIGERRRLDGGALSLYTTHRKGRFGLLYLAWLALRRKLDQARDFDATTTDALIVHARRAHMRVATDGEVRMMDTPLRYRIRPAALQVFVPAAREAPA